MEISDRAKGEGLQIPLFNAAGLQIRPNGFIQFGSLNHYVRIGYKCFTMCWN